MNSDSRLAFTDVTLALMALSVTPWRPALPYTELLLNVSILPKQRALTRNKQAHNISAKSNKSSYSTFYQDSHAVDGRSDHRRKPL